MASRRPLVSVAGIQTELPTADVLAGYSPRGSATLSFGGGAIVAAGTYEFDIPAAATITSLKSKVGSAGGSFTVGVQINGAAVTGPSAVAVSTNTVTTTAATAANTVAAGDTASIVISSVSGSPTDARLVVTWSYT